jgi:Adenylate and Guanylate cyclase catalytic domain
MESTGVPGYIQITQKTADILVSAGKECWIVKRDEMVEVKGKGSMVTYWLTPSKTNTSASGRQSIESVDITTNRVDTVGPTEVTSRLVE